MKKLSMCILMGVLMVSCNNATKDTEVTKDSTTVATPAVTPNYPYRIEHPDNWDMGSTDNTMTVLSSLKAYETGNIGDCVRYFGDSIHLAFDGLDIKVSNDSLKALFSRERALSKSYQIKMDDWESVISKDKKTEYVSLWYKEIWEDSKGKVDSAFMMDDMQIKSGKIVSIDEKSRKFAGKKM